MLGREYSALAACAALACTVIGVIVDNVEVPDINTFANFASAGGTVIVFVGIQNVTGRRNVNGFEWNRRSNAADALEQLGVFPLVGLEWRF